jgi:hypothetical protein
MRKIIMGLVPAMIFLNLLFWPSVGGCVWNQVEKNRSPEGPAKKQKSLIGIRCRRRFFKSVPLTRSWRLALEPS